MKADGSVDGWDPTTGDATPFPQNEGQAAALRERMARAAAGAVAYAVAKGDMRRVQDFYRGPSIAGIVTPQTT